MSGFECGICGLSECDLPDGVDLETFFEREDGRTWCIVHIEADVRELFMPGETEGF